MNAVLDRKTTVGIVFSLIFFAIAAVVSKNLIWITLEGISALALAASVLVQADLGLWRRREGNRKTASTNPPSEPDQIPFDADQKLYQQLFERSTALMCIHDLNGRILKVNPAAEQALGYTESEMLRRNLADFISPGLERQFEGYLDRVRSRLSDGGILRMIAKDGQELILEYRNVKIEEPGKEPYILGHSHDVTDQRRSEETLQESELRFRQLADRIKEVIHIYDSKAGGILYVSPAYEEVWGRRGEDLVSGHDIFLETVHEDDRTTVIESMRQNDLGHSSDIEYRVVRPDKSIRWVRDRTFPVKSNSGRTYRRVGIAEDMTEQKVARARLAVQHGVASVLADAREIKIAAASLARIICENLSLDVVAIWVIDREEKALECAGVWRIDAARFREIEKETRSLKFTRGAGLPGRVWQSAAPEWIPDVTVDDGFVRRPAAVRDGMKGGFGFPIRSATQVLGVIEVFDRQMREPDAGVLDTLSALGSQIGHFLERIQARETLRESQMRFQMAFDHAPIGMALVAPDGRWLKVNSLLCEMLGYSEAEMLETNFQALTEPGDLDIGFESTQRLLKDEVRFFQIEKRYVHKGGHNVWVQVSVSLVRDSEGVPLYFVAHFQDVTMRRSLEMEIRRARDAALESNRLKSEFLGNVSHEIRTPMNGVIGMTELLLNTDLSAEQREYAETIQFSGAAMLSVIADILDFSRLDSGDVVFDTVNFDLEPTVRACVESFREQAGRKGIGLECVVSCDQTLLRGDPVRLKQVLSHLIGNAIKFTGRGEIIVRVAKENETPSHVAVRVEVEDSGIGIHPDHQKRLFQPFVQADGSSTRRYSGIGLGLAISRQLVEMMGGGIDVETGFGKGSKFIFTVKFEKQSVPGSAMASPVKALPLAGPAPAFQRNKYGQTSRFGPDWASSIRLTRGHPLDTQAGGIDGGHGQAIDLRQLELIRSMQSEGEQGLVNELINIFLDDAGKRIAAIQQAIDCGDTQLAHQMAHSLKGSSQSIGATLMGSACLQLEEDAKLHLAAQCQIALDTLKSEFGRVVDALTAYKNGGV